ncbi:MAG: hypothetical protein LQ342_002200 [Letrouitia transgressa]|nr:MAG: hypothetical protein LQ342_002200 [Letrouitia transgressa]
MMHSDRSLPRYEPHSDEKFPLRYWFDATYYKDGGPVIVLQSGETDGTGRLPFLQKGIVYQLAKATNGIGVILEHRYYGTSFPTPDLSTENLRFLTTEQALADMAYFAQTVKFNGLEDKDLTAPKTPYIGYGGSYAGAFVAYLRVQYPDVYWGNISTVLANLVSWLTMVKGTIGSSAVTEAIYDFWRYYEPIRIYGPPDCISNQQKLINIVDNILLQNDTTRISQLKSAFNLENLTYNDDFAQVVSNPIGAWQGRNWDPAVNDPSFFDYCNNITSSFVVNNSTLNLTTTTEELIAAGGYGDQVSQLTVPMLNFINFVITGFVETCDETLDQCYSTHNKTAYELDGLDRADYRSWPYQYCTEYGYFQTGSGVPKDQLPLISRLLTLEYLSIICREAFNITEPPDVDRVNKYGGFNISYPRLAFVDGEIDPWRGASPHSPLASDRPDTTDEPFILIDDAVHHWDENGLFPNETTADLPPAPVREAQAEEVEFVKAWLDEFYVQKKRRRTRKMLLQ